MTPFTGTDHFTERGFCILENVIPKRPLKDIFTDIGTLFDLQARWLGCETAGLANIMRNVMRGDVERYINTARVTQDLPSVQRLLASEIIEYIAHMFNVKFAVTSTKPSVHIMADDLAVPGGYHRSPPHQDWRSIQGSLDNLVLWIPLTPVRGNGLEVIRGSHKYGLLPTTDHIQTPEVVDPERLGPWEAIDCDPGDVVAFSSFLVHRTAAGPGLRIAISTRFNNAAEATFIERGFPNHYRTTQRTDVEWNPNEHLFPNGPPAPRSDALRGVPSAAAPHIEPGA